MRDPGAWWNARSRRPSADGGKPLRMSLAYAYDSAMLNSAQVRAFGDLPAIRETLAAEVAGSLRPARLCGGPRRGHQRSHPQPRRHGRQSAPPRPRPRDRCRACAGAPKRARTSPSASASPTSPPTATSSFPVSRRGCGRSSRVVQPLLRDSGVEYTRSLHEVARLDAQDGALASSAGRSRAICSKWRAPIGRSISPAPPIFSGRASTEAAGGIADQFGGTLRPRRRCPPPEPGAQRTGPARGGTLAVARTSVSNAEVRLRALMNDPRIDRERRRGRPGGRSADALRTPAPADRLSSARSHFGPRCSRPFFSTVPPCCGRARRRSSRCRGSTQSSKATSAGAASTPTSSTKPGTTRPTMPNRPGSSPACASRCRSSPTMSRRALSRRQLETRQAENQGFAIVSTIVGRGRAGAQRIRGRLARGRRPRACIESGDPIGPRARESAGSRASAAPLGESRRQRSRTPAFGPGPTGRRRGAPRAGADDIHGRLPDASARAGHVHGRAADRHHARRRCRARTRLHRKARGGRRERET